MSKVLLFSDIHIDAHKKSQDRLHQCLDCLKWVCQTARDRDIKNVIFGGDLFQDRQRISVYAYHQTYKIFADHSDLEFTLLLGNHDMWYFEKTDISSVAPIGGLPHVTVIDKPATCSIENLNFDFLPFTHDPITALQKHFSEKSPVLISHIAVDDAILNFHYRTKADVSVELDHDMVHVTKELFDEYQKVFLGHYHGAQKLNNKVEYIGSPLQLNFSEAFQHKHIIEFDTETFELEYIENTFSPKHFILTPDELDQYDLNKNFIRIHLEDNTSDMMDLRMKIMEKNPEAQVIFRNEKKEDDCPKQVSFKLLEGDTLERYVEAVGHGELNSTELLNLGKEICLED